MKHLDWPGEIARVSSQGTAFVVVTLASVKGSAPQVAGAKAIVSARGLESGTIGGGRFEAKAIAHARALLSARETVRCDLVSWNLVRDVGMTCGGLVSLLFEVYSEPSWKFVVFGAGHVAQEFVPLLCRLDCSVTVVDERAEWLARLPSLSNLKCVPDLNLSEIPADSWFILMTRGHDTDFGILTEILRTRCPPYLGVLGSDRKAAKLHRDIRALGLPDTFECPIGVRIGNNSPMEISVSILAQVLECRELCLSRVHAVADADNLRDM
jgi:xanthine dehydrogenase accessory factor